MNGIVHERPGVYSAYDASAAVSGGQAAKVVGVAAKAAQGSVGKAVTVTGYAAGAAAFGEDIDPGMCTLLRLLFANGASVVRAVRVSDDGTDEDYQAAFEALGNLDVQVMICDSGEESVQQLLREAVESASALRRERIAVAGGSGCTVDELIARAEALNSERMVLVGPDALDAGGGSLGGVFAAAAVAGAIASEGDPAVPLNGVELRGLYGLAEDYNDNEIDLLVRGGVTPLEAAEGVISPVRGITTRTKTGGAADTAWRELTTILIVDHVIPAVRAAIRSKFARSKNNARSRAAIRSQVIVELEKQMAAEVIDGYDSVSVRASEDDPTVCLVEFGFSVAHGLNQVYLTVHISI
ncbi:MAG: phage tail sheath protein [Oscillibacter sp.]|nr:phage tail sheath protein [Oscillibacter sp.]